MMFPDLIGYIAAALTSISAIPQLIKIYKMKSAKTLSWIFSMIMIASAILWLVYGIIINKIPIIVCNFLLLCIWIGIIILKLKYDLLVQ